MHTAHVSFREIAKLDRNPLAFSKSQLRGCRLLRWSRIELEVGREAALIAVRRRP
jgi:hypothetical protein